MNEDPRDIQIAELKEEVRQLRHLLGLEPDRVLLAAIRDHLGISYRQGVLIATLHRAGAAWVSKYALDLAIPQYDDSNPRRVETICVHVCKLRKRFGSDFILNKWGRGYTLGAPGVRACRAALDAARENATADNLVLFGGQAA